MLGTERYLYGNKCKGEVYFHAGVAHLDNTFLPDVDNTLESAL